MLSRPQAYPYSLKTVGIITDSTNHAQYFSAVNSLGEYQLGLEVIIPGETLTVEGLFCHFRFTHFDGAAASIIKRVGVQNQFGLPGDPLHEVTLNLPTDAPLDRLEFRKDLTPLRYSTDKNIVVVTFNEAITGFIDVFKVDMLYTTLGIRSWQNQ